MIPIVDINWSPIINFIIQIYFENTTVCLLWPQKDHFTLTIKESLYGIVNIDTTKLFQAFDNNIAEYQELEEKFKSNKVEYNDLTLKLTLSIEKSHCESFVVFEKEILPFIESFENASRYSVWRSKRNHFLFATSDQKQEKQFQEHMFFQDQPHILVIFAQRSSTNFFELKTNKFKGPKRDASKLILLDRFYGNNGTFQSNANLYPDKLSNLEGREVIVAGFDYHPYFVIKYGLEPNNSYDLAYGGTKEGAVQIDGTETRVVLILCELINCTILIDSSEADDWGEAYANFSGDGSLGMIAKGTAEVSVGAMYSWDTDYIHLDMSMYLVRTGVTCLVPAPRRLASWLLPLEPFQWNLWLAVLAYLLLEVISVSLTYRFETWFLANENHSWKESITNAFVITLKLFVSQTGSGNVASQTVRVLLFTCFLNDIIITSIYGGGLASILTVPSYSESPDTIQRMLKHQLKWAANSEAWVTTIRKSDDPNINGILKNFFLYSDEKLENLGITRSDYGFTLERLPFGHFAIGDYLTPESIHKLKIMQEDLYYQYSVAFVTRCWALLGKFDDLIYWWHSAGLDKFWEWRVVANNMNVQKQKQVEATMYSNMEDIGPVKLGMSNFAGMLLIWLLGISISCFVFIYELLRGCGEKSIL
ncbi:ionotropic receptor 41a [Haematobia irritans]|uniref:ionotropic receptor 41a n=1 Tax=Haematobia irritans TaxID=7368 RepID=UPI003F500DB2